MKRKFTFLMTAMALMIAIIGSGAEAWGQKITSVDDIVSGTAYYIGATNGSGTDYYFKTTYSQTSSSVAGTAVTSKADAVVVTFTQSGDNWTISFDNGYFLGLKSSKDNGKVQILENSASWTISDQSDDEIRLSMGDYSLQKNNNGTQFGSYKNTQTDVWLEEAGGSDPSISVTPTTITWDNKPINVELSQTIAVSQANLDEDIAVSTTIGTVEPATITAGSEATNVTLTYTPTAAGDFSGTVTFTSGETIATTTVSGSAYDPSQVETYEIFTGNLEEGDYVVYYNGKAMKNTVASNRLGYETVTPSNNSIVNPDASIVWHIAQSGDYWTFYNANVAKYAASTGKKNQATLLDECATDNALWTVNGSSTYEFVNKERANSSSDPGNCYLRNNGTSGYACYASATGGALTLYKKSVAKAATPTLTESQVFTTKPFEVTITNNESGATVYYTTDGSDPTTATETSFTGASTTIQINQTTTVKAMAVIDGKANSDIASATYSEQKLDPNNQWSLAAYTATIGGENTFPTFSTDSDGTVTYSSSNTNAATINEYGEINLLAAGVTTITASTTETTAYMAGSASYELTVIESALTTMDQIFAKATAVGSTATNVTVTFDNWVVSGVKGSNVYVTDGTKGFIIYQSGHGFEVGDILSGTVACQIKLYNGAAEIMGVTSSTEGLSVSTGGTVTPQVSSIADLSGVNTGSLIKVENVTYNGTVFVDDNANEIKPYTVIINNLAVFFRVREYNVTGIYVQYNTTKEIGPRSEDDIYLIPLANKVETPTFDVAAGTYCGAQSVEISTLTDGASIYYTTDGTDPSTESTEYTEPLAISTNCTIKAIGVKDGYQNSDIATAEYIINIQYAIEYQDCENGSISGPETKCEGETVEVTATPSSGYILDKIQVDGENIVGTSFEMPANDVTVSATFIVEPSYFTWDLSTNSYDEEPTEKLVTWSNARANMTLAKNTSTIAANNYLGGGDNSHTRFYKNQLLTISPVMGNNITKIEITSTSPEYANALQSSTWENATAAVSGSVVTITPTNVANSVSVTMGAATRATEVKVYYNEIAKYGITVDDEIANGSVSADLAEAYVGQTVTLSNTPAAHYYLKNYTVLKDDLETEVTVTDNTFTMPDCEVYVTATFEATTPCTLTYMLNGEEYTTQNIYSNEEIGEVEEAPDAELIPANVVFGGWTQDNITTYTQTAPAYITTSTIATGDMTVYAVFVSSCEGSAEWNKVTDEISLSAGDVIVIASTSKGYVAADIAESTNYLGVTESTFEDDKISSLSNDAVRFTLGGNYDAWTLTNECGEELTSSAAKKLAWDGEDEVSEWSISITDGDAIISPNSSGYGRILHNVTNTRFLNYTSETSASMLLPQIYKRGIGSISYYFTTITEVANASDIVDASKNYTVKSQITITGTTTVSGLLINPTVANIIVNDGAQLIINNKGVKATVKKDIAAWTTDPVGNWYLISSPVGTVVTSEVANLISAPVEEAITYDLYRYNESAKKWYNDQGEHPFNSINSGEGYLYARKDAASLEFAGNATTESVSVPLSYTGDNGKMAGINLLGNPFTQNITLSNVSGNLAEGCYLLNADGTWGTKITSGSIAPMQGFLVQATSAGNATISKPGTSKDEMSSDKKANIEIVVSNSNYSDNAYAMFGNGVGLNKINHRNNEAPMVYVPMENEKYAVACIDENAASFPVAFHASTTGYYTISLKSSQTYEGYNDFDYLHLIDNMKGEEIDMLLEDGYRFIGTPNDNPNRFTVKLHLNGIDENDDDNDNFVYQYDNNLIVNGEGTLQVIDMLGRIVINRNVNGETVSISGLTTGAYIVRLIGNDVKSQKIIVR